MKKIRTLRPNDIELRVADKNNKGEVHMLMYITSRSATNLLDETYGMENYNIEYVDVAGQIYCRLSIWDEEHSRYIVRMDTGEEAKISADKSLASDALKRSIVRLGVTELYSGPSIYVEDDGYGNRGYRVKSIEYDNDRNITDIVVANRFGKAVFEWHRDEAPQKPFKLNKPEEEEEEDLEYRDNDNLEKLRVFFERKKKEEGVDKAELEKYKNFYKDKANGFKFFNPEKQWTRWLDMRR